MRRWIQKPGKCRNVFLSIRSSDCPSIWQLCIIWTLILYSIWFGWILFFFCLRYLLFGKTFGLLQLYLQPPLQGYPSFNNFPALYNASSTLSMLITRDAMALFQINSFESLLSGIEEMAMRIPRYLTTVGMFVDEFGNINTEGNPTLEEIKSYTGNWFSVIIHFSTPGASNEKKVS